MNDGYRTADDMQVIVKEYKHKGHTVRLIWRLRGGTAYYIVIKTIYGMPNGSYVYDTIQEADGAFNYFTNQIHNEEIERQRRRLER